MAKFSNDRFGFIGIGFSMLGISLFMMILFYYIINHPKMANLWSWLIFFAINAVLNFIVGWQWVLADYYGGLMFDSSGVALNISEGDILCFGVSNAILSMVAFTLFSYLFKWWSTNASKAPF